VTEHHLPQERDLPAGRLPQLKEDLMAQIEHDLETEAQATPVATHRRRHRIALTAAALAVGFGVASTLVLGGHDSASANTAELTEDGAIVISIHEAEHPEDLQRRLNDLGVPAVVDFLESGFGCDPARSTGWVQEPRGEALFSHAPTSPDDDAQFILHPDQLRPGETVVFEFQLDEHEGDLAAMATTRLSTSSVGPCVPVPNGSIVDAEAGIVGG
jgi:hypothetical protein